MHQKWSKIGKFIIPTIPIFAYHPRKSNVNMSVNVNKIVEGTKFQKGQSI